MAKTIKPEKISVYLKKYNIDTILIENKIMELYDQNPDEFPAFAQLILGTSEDPGTVFISVNLEYGDPHLTMAIFSILQEVCDIQVSEPYFFSENDNMIYFGDDAYEQFAVQKFGKDANNDLNDESSLDDEDFPILTTKKNDKKSVH